MLKKPVSLLLILSMILSIAMPINVYASDNDYAGHWAGDTIQQWIDEGKISGYPDGSFKPDNNVTRAEFVTMVNKAFNFTATTDISFTDVNSNDWFYQEVQKASNAGYIVGVSETQFDPSSNLTREQASVIVARILNLNSDSESSDVFNDLNDVSSWATELVLASAKAGIIKGYEDNTFRPQNPITRAEAVVILDRAVKTNDVVEPPEPTIPAEPEEPDKPDTPSHKGSSSSGGRHSGGRHDEEELKVAEVSAIKDITVEFGGELKLPGTVKATLNDEEETEVTLAIDWAENKDFDAKKAGNYEFTGTLSKLKDEELKFTIPEDKATVTVKVTVEKTNPGEDTIHVTGIELDEHSITLQNGETATLTYTISPLDATNKDVTWKSSDSNVAVVKGTSSEKSTGSAIVTAKTTGTAIVTVTTDDGDKTAECKVTVTEAGEEAELAQAIEAAEKAMADYLAAGGKVEDSEYVAVAEVIKSGNLADIKAATDALVQATENIEAARDLVEQKKEALVAAQGEAAKATEDLKGAMSQRDEKMQDVEAEKSAKLEAEEQFKSAEDAIGAEAADKVNAYIAAKEAIAQTGEQLEAAEGQLVEANKDIANAKAANAQAAEELENAEALDENNPEKPEKIESAIAAIGLAKEQLEAAEGQLVEANKAIKAAKDAKLQAEEHLKNAEEAIGAEAVDKVNAYMVAKAAQAQAAEALKAAEGQLAEAKENVANAKASVSQAQEKVEATEAELLQAEENLKSLLSGAEK